MFKVIASLCFIVGAGGYGFLYYKEMLYRYREMIYIKYILSRMERELENSHASFGQICLVVGQKLKEPYQGIFAKEFESIRQNHDFEPEEAWENAVTQMEKECFLLKKDTFILKQLAKAGSADNIAIPLDAIRQTKEEWEKGIERVQKDKNEKGKVIIYLGIAGGVVLSILFW